MTSMSTALPTPARPSLPPVALEHVIGSGTKWPIALTVLVTLAAQLITVSSKAVLILDWRPADLASIARNYYRNGFDFGHPQILWGGAGPGYVEMECPLVPYAVAWLYAVFGVHDWVAIALPMLAGLALTAVVHLFARRSFGDLAGLVAGLFIAVSPTWVELSTGLWPDVMPVLFGTLGLYVLTRWADQDRPMQLLVVALCLSLAVLLKLTALYLGAPVLCVFWQKYGSSWWRRPAPWIVCLLVIVPSALWYTHAYGLYQQYGNTFGILNSGYLKFGDAGLLTSPGFYVRTAVRVVLFHLTPLGALFVAAALVSRLETAADTLATVWLGAVLVYLLIAATGVNIGHYQYALPIVAPAAMLAGRGCTVLLRRASWVWDMAGSRVATAVLLVVCAVNGVSANVLYQVKGTNHRARSVAKKQTGEVVARLTSPGDLIVVADSDMDDRTPTTSMTPPEIFYFSDRRGWYRAFAWLTPAAIEDLHGQGARYLAVSAYDALYFRTQYEALYEALSRRYRSLTDDEDGIVYDLATPASSGR